VRSISVAGIRTDAQTFSEAVNTFLSWSDNAEKRYISTATAYTLMMADQDEQVRAALETADMVTADGMPIVWMQRLLGSRHAERVYGPDLVLAVCRCTSERGGRHFFYGGREGVSERLVGALRTRFPDLEVVGAHGPVGDVSADVPDEATVQLLNAAKPDIIWVGLGSPKQDIWMYTYRPHLQASLLVGVGAAFDFLSGVKAQAPMWMQRSGLEWLFRLSQEPGRLWKRYMIYNLRFVLRVTSDLVAHGRQAP